MTRLSVAETSPLVSPDNMLRYWEMDSFFTCPVVGACLTVSEQRQLLKKACISAKGKTLFELHEILVSCADNENKLSKRVDRLLHRKYLQKSSELMEMNEPVSRNIGKNILTSANSAFWCTRPRQNRICRPKPNASCSVSFT
jgi:hypothetical protein